MNRYVCSILLALSLSACNNSIDPPIEREKMVDMLTDYYMIEAMARHEMKNDSTFDVNIYYADMMKSYGVTFAEFDSALAYYGARPLYFKEMYDDIFKRLESKAKEYRDIIENK